MSVPSATRSIRYAQPARYVFIGHLARSIPKNDDFWMDAPPEESPLIYREEVLGIIGALADLVVVTRDIHDLLRDDEEEEE